MFLVLIKRKACTQPYFLGRGLETNLGPERGIASERFESDNIIFRTQNFICFCGKENDRKRQLLSTIIARNSTHKTTS